jgi:hypothetical protein
MNTKEKTKTRRSRTSDSSRKERKAEVDITPEERRDDILSKTDDLRGEIITLDLPDVKDIPGQEHIYPPPLGELADTTISSADEEGGDLWEGENELGGES